MSLKVWLPLNGDLTQQGTANTTFSGTPAWKTYGKIGNAALNLQNKITCTTVALNGVQFFSVTFWARIENNPDSTANWMDVIGFTDQTSSGSNGQFRFETGYGNIAQSGVHWHDNATNAIISGAYTYNTGAEFDKWHHIAVTISDTAVCSYYDGVLKSTLTSNLNKGHLTGAWWLGEATTRGCIQDVRIYDHVLSAAEIKEISQGLVLHYKLDSFYGGYGNPNLLPASDTTFFNTTRSFEFEGWVKNFYTTDWVNEHLTVGQQYTLSYTVTCISIPDTSIYSVSETQHSPILIHQGSGWSQVTTTNDGIKSTNLLPGQSRTYKCTFTFATATESPIYYGFCGYTCVYRNTDRTSSAYARFRIDNLKLELGSDATPWIPNINDENVDITYIQDSSGYNHNGTIIGNPSIISNTPRYSFGMHLGKTRINSSTGFPSGDNPNFTIAFWTKIFSDITYVSYGDLCGMYDTGQGSNTFRLELCGSPPGNNLMWFRGPSGQNGGGFNMNSSSSNGWFSKDIWHHVALVGDGANKKYYCYLDGQLCQTYNGSANSWTPTGQVYLGDTVEATADFSDFRIYCTALLDSDIKQLYNVGMKIDKFGSAHSFEFIEQQSNIIFPIELSRTYLKFTNGLNKYTQANCQVTLTEYGYHIYRPPNLTVANDGKTMWGGLLINNQTTRTIAAYDASRDNILNLQKNHTYIFAFHAKGKSSNSPSLIVESNMGWDRIAGVGPNPTYLARKTIPVNFNGEQDCYIIFKIEDDIVKIATENKSNYVQGTSYLSYRDLCLNYEYTSTGELGTDLYLTDFRLYDITNDIAKITKQGQAKFQDFVEQLNKVQIRKNSEFLSSNFIER